MAKATCTIQPVHALGQFSSRNHHDLPQHLRVYPTREPFMSWFPWITNLLVQVSDLSVHCPSPKPLQHTRFPASGHLHSTVSTWQQRASHYSFRIKGGLLAFAQNAFHEYVSTVLEESKRDGWRKAKTCHGKQWSHSPATRWWAATWKKSWKIDLSPLCFQSSTWMPFNAKQSGHLNQPFYLCLTSLHLGACMYASQKWKRYNIIHKH